MSQSRHSKPLPVPSSAYTREYYEAHAQGHEEFNASQGRVLPLRLSIPLALADVRLGLRVLDLGCGRGELVFHCAQRGAKVWGIDYAEEAVHLALKNLLGVADPATRANLLIQQGDAKHLPFSDMSLDVVLMLDIVEHLLPAELTEALTEVWRILRPGGRLIVHTMPNLWYYRYGYPLYRVLQRLRGTRLPVDPRDRWGYKHVHVNEQDPSRLRRALAAQGFDVHVWVQTTQTYTYESNWVMRFGMRLLTHSDPFRWVFCDDIFAVAVRPSDKQLWQSERIPR